MVGDYGNLGDLEGTCSKYDPDRTTPIPAGSFVTDYGKQIHYDGAKGEEVKLEIVGMGPTTMTPAEAKQVCMSATSQS